MPVEGIFLQAAKRYRGQSAAEPSNNQLELFSDIMQSMEEGLRKSKKVKRGDTLEKADVDGAWLTAYSRIARRRRDEKDMGVTRYSYELAPGVRV
jgi:hypothetical protein